VFPQVRGTLLPDTAFYFQRIVPFRAWRVVHNWSTRRGLPGVRWHTGGMDARVRYADVRPYAVPDSFAELAGPAEGVVVLPTSLDWTPKHTYDLADDADMRLLYETVLREAMHAEELRRHVNGDLLARVWPRLWLPLRLRVMWESRFPNLVSVAA
jgi:hypothetical protein